MKDTDVILFRVNSVQYAMSVSGTAFRDAFDHASHDDIAQQATCSDFRVRYLPPKRDGDLPAFVVSTWCSPKEPELMLRTVAARIEDAYDASAGVEIVR